MSKVAKVTAGLIVVTVLSKILGFARELVLGGIYGATAYSDIYITTMNIPFVIFAVLASAISTSFIPLYYENSNLENGDKKAFNFINNVFTIVFVVGLVLSLLGYVFAKQLVNIFAIGFEGEQLDIAMKFTKIMILGGVFIGINTIISSLFHIKGNFVIPGITSIPFNLIIIISMVLSAKINIYILPIGTLIAMVSQFIFQFVIAKIKYKYKYQPIINLKDQYIKKMLWLTGPVLIGVSVNQINTIVDRTLASTLATGSISALNYANKLTDFVSALFVASIVTVIFPTLSKLNASKNIAEFEDYTIKSINSIIVLMVPITIGSILLASPIVTLLFERGAFDTTATQMTSQSLVFYSIGMIAFGIRELLGKVFYSLQDTKTPMINGSISIVLNIVLSLVLVRYMGHKGIALATSISAIFCIGLLFINLVKRINDFEIERIVFTFIRCIIAALIMGKITIFLYNNLLEILYNLYLGSSIALLVSILIGGTIYGLLVTLLKVEEATKIINLSFSLIKKASFNTIYLVFITMDKVWYRVIVMPTKKAVLKKCSKKVYISKGSSILSKNVYVGNNVFIGRNSILISQDRNIVIGNDVKIGSNVTILTGQYDISIVGNYMESKKNNLLRKENDVIIEDGVCIGSNVNILQGVRISKNSIIKSGSIITEDI